MLKAHVKLLQCIPVVAEHTVDVNDNELKVICHAPILLQTLYKPILHAISNCRAQYPSVRDTV